MRVIILGGVVVLFIICLVLWDMCNIYYNRSLRGDKLDEFQMQVSNKIARYTLTMTHALIVIMAIIFKIVPDFKMDTFDVLWIIVIFSTTLFMILAIMHHAFFFKNRIGLLEKISFLILLMSSGFSVSDNIRSGHPFISYVSECINFISLCLICISVFLRAYLDHKKDI